MRSIAEWWTLLKAYTDASIVGPQREAVEAYLETVQFRNLVQVWEAHQKAPGRGRYPQLLRSGEIPGDRPDQQGKAHQLPAWIDCQLDEWENRDGFGWTLTIFVTEATREWQIKITRRGNFGWTEVIKERMP